MATETFGIAGDEEIVQEVDELVLSEAISEPAAPRSPKPSSQRSSKPEQITPNT